MQEEVTQKTIALIFRFCFFVLDDSGVRWVSVEESVYLL